MDYTFLLFMVFVAGAATLVIFMANFSKKKARGAQTSSLGRGGFGEPTLEDMRPGGVFSLRAVGAAMDDIDLTVEARHLYDEDGFQWAELECNAGARKVWVTVERDDELEISVTLRKLSLDDLKVTKKDLSRFDDNEQGGFKFENDEYLYDDSGEAVFHRNGNVLSREEFRYWDFLARDGETSISIERWRGDGAFECHVSQPLKSSQITIYSVSGET